MALIDITYITTKELRGMRCTNTKTEGSNYLNLEQTMFLLSTLIKFKLITYFYNMNYYSRAHPSSVKPKQDTIHEQNTFTALKQVNFY